MNAIVFPVHSDILMIAVMISLNFNYHSPFVLKVRLSIIEKLEPSGAGTSSVEIVVLHVEGMALPIV